MNTGELYLGNCLGIFYHNVPTHYSTHKGLCKSKNCISYLHSKAIAINIFDLFTAKFGLYVLPHFHACAKVLGLEFAY